MQTLFDIEDPVLDLPVVKSAEGKRPHLQPEVILVTKYPKAIAVIKQGDRFQRYDFNAGLLPEDVFSRDCRGLVHDILGCWRQDEAFENKKNKASNGDRPSLAPVWITSGKYYELAKAYLENAC